MFKPNAMVRNVDYQENVPRNFGRHSIKMTKANVYACLAQVDLVKSTSMHTIVPPAKQHIHIEINR